MAKDGSTRTGSKTTGGTPNRKAARALENVCTFWLGERCFGLDVALVGEVVGIDTFVSVPLSPSAVRGIFNLRGTPVPLIDLYGLVEARDFDAPHQPKVALVVKNDEMIVGLAVDRLDGVVAPGGRALVRSSAMDEHPMVQGFLEGEGAEQPVITVLDSRALVEKLESMKYAHVHDED